jgi:hypothetical protein
MHPLSEFEGMKRSCVAALQRRAERKRAQQAERRLEAHVDAAAGKGARRRAAQASAAARARDGPDGGSGGSQTSSGGGGSGGGGGNWHSGGDGSGSTHPGSSPYLHAISPPADPLQQWQAPSPIVPPQGFAAAQQQPPLSQAGSAALPPTLPLHQERLWGNSTNMPMLPDLTASAVFQDLQMPSGMVPVQPQHVPSGMVPVQPPGVPQLQQQAVPSWLPQRDLLSPANLPALRAADAAATRQLRAPPGAAPASAALQPHVRPASLDGTAAGRLQDALLRDGPAMPTLSQEELDLLLVGAWHQPGCV